MFLTNFVSNWPKTSKRQCVKFMQLFCDKDSPVDPQLYDNMCVQVEYYQNILEKFD